MALKRLTNRERFEQHTKLVITFALGRKWDCWEWQAALDLDGYGLFKIGSRTDGSRKSVRVHRWAYEEFKGPIPKGHELDHLCQNRRCANPDHVEPVTMLENQARSWHRGRVTPSRKQTEITKQKIRLAKLGKKASEEARRKMSVAQSRRQWLRRQMGG